MARKAPPPMPAARRLRFPVRASLAVAACAAVVAGVAAIGLSAAAMIDHHERFNLPLTAIDFDPPLWIDRRAFLAEVRYLGDLPERFQSYDPAATDRVRRAFAKHPWVGSVGDGYTTVARRYVLTVTFRQPALTVTAVADDVPTTRVVDGSGVLLPSAKSFDAIPELIGAVESPIPAAGTVWNDPTVLRAVALAKQYDAKTIAKSDGGWRVIERGGRVLVVGR